MKKYKRNFLKHYNIAEQDFISCMIHDCGLQAVDTHHVLLKSRGGTDEVSNLCALCRTHHQAAHFLVEPYLSEEYLLEVVQDNLNR